MTTTLISIQQSEYEKRRIGPYRPEANRTIFYKKDIGVLARNGFSYDLSKDILSLDKKIESI